MSSGHEDSSSSNKHFEFDIDENGVVTAYYEVENDVRVQESIDSRDTFVIEGSQITHTKQTSNGPEIVVFTDPEGDGTYVTESSSDSDDNGNDDSNDDRPGDGDRKGYEFTIVDNVVTEVFEIKDGVKELDPIDDDGTESYEVNENGEVIRTDIEDLGTEITTYADINGDGIYHRIAEQWAADTPGTGRFKIEDRLLFDPTDDDDLIAVRGGEDCRGGNGLDKFVIREADHLRIGDFKSVDDDLVFDTGLGLTSREQLESYITGAGFEAEGFVVDFGPDISITLIGVTSADQISWDDVVIDS